jgi:hypothetical protein
VVADRQDCGYLHSRERARRSSAWPAWLRNRIRNAKRRPAGAESADRRQGHISIGIQLSALQASRDQAAAELGQEQPPVFTTCKGCRSMRHISLGGGDLLVTRHQMAAL